jgi:hypothetical protein
MMGAEALFLLYKLIACIEINILFYSIQGVPLTLKVFPSQASKKNILLKLTYY